MNTITYLSRQFDVLTSARTPPSTPTAGSPSFSRQYPYPSRQDSDSDPSVKRVKTWSTKSFLFPPPTQQSMTPPPKRSFSSPTDFISFASVRPSLGSPSSETPISSKITLKAVIRRIFFMRLFVLLCHLLSAAWFSVATKPVTEVVPDPIVDSSISDSDSKDSEEEAKEKSLSSPQPLLPDPQPPMSRNAYIFRFHRSSAMNTMQESDSLSAAPPPMNTKQESDSLSVAPPSIGSETVPFPTDSSRTSIHVSNTQKSPFLLPKTLVLDLDETLIHSTSRALDSSVSSGSGLLGLSTFGQRNKGAGHMVEVVLGGRSTLYHVYKRPFVDFFLRTVSGWYTLVIFTASMQEYADPVIDWLDAGRGILARRLFRDSCTQLPNGYYTKDLSIVEEDLSRVCLVDNSPISYRINEANGIPIEGWTHDPSDEALLDLLPVLDSLRFTNDVRRVLGIRGFS